MGRLPDVERRVELLDAVVAYLAEHGLAGTSLRPMAGALGVSVNGLVHHFGTKDELVVAALRRAIDVQSDVQERWMSRHPGLSQTDLLRRWWRWINASSANLALVRLGLEAAALDATERGLPGSVRADQIALWRLHIEQRLIAESVPADIAVVEASLVKAMFTGLVIDLIATGERRRLTHALEVGLARLESVVRASAGRSERAVPPPRASVDRGSAGAAPARRSQRRSTIPIECGAVSTNPWRRESGRPGSSARSVM